MILKTLFLAAVTAFTAPAFAINPMTQAEFLAYAGGKYNPTYHRFPNHAFARVYEESGTLRFPMCASIAAASASTDWRFSQTSDTPTTNRTRLFF